MIKGFLILFLGLAVSAFAEPNFEAKSVFPQASCNTKDAISDLKARLANSVEPTWDGHLPWPGILGHWGDSSTGTHIQVNMRKVESSKFGIIQVSFISVCDETLLAYGSKIIKKSDFNKEFLKIDLVNLHLSKGTTLYAELQVAKSQTEKPRSRKKQAPFVSVRVFEIQEDENGKVRNVERDNFKGNKL